MSRSPDTLPGQHHYVAPSNEVPLRAVDAVDTEAALQAWSAVLAGLDNPNVVFHADDRPYGFIEATIRREDADDASAVWATVPGFC